MKQQVRRPLTFLLILVMILTALPTVVPGVGATEPTGKFSEDLIAFLKEQEGFSPGIYWDYGQYTLGYGTRWDQSRYPDGTITEAEADYELRLTLAQFEKEVDRVLARGTVVHTQNQYDAILSFTYNLGSQWMSPSNRIYEYILFGYPSEEAFLDAMLAWSKAGGEILDGLVKRRMEEADLYLNGNYGGSSHSYMGAKLLVNTTDDTAVIESGDGTSALLYRRAGESVGQLPSASREGYDFTGWYDRDGTLYTEDTPAPGGVVTLLAGWESNEEPCQHLWGNGTITAEPGCGKIGVRTYHCVSCSATRRESVAPIGEHSYEKDVCTLCGQEDPASTALNGTAEPLEPLSPGILCNHGDTRFFGTALVTCTEDGNSPYYQCTACGKRFADEDCTEEIKEDPVVKAPGHSFQLTYTVEADCKWTGAKCYTCSVCEYVETEILPALGHSFGKGTLTTPTTCMEEGIRTYTCNRCGEQEEGYVSPTGHSYDEGRVTTPATGSREGLLTYTCGSCGETRTETIPPTGRGLGTSAYGSADSRAPTKGTDPRDVGKTKGLSPLILYPTASIYSPS